MCYFTEERTSDCIIISKVTNLLTIEQISLKKLSKMSQEIY